MGKWARLTNIKYLIAFWTDLQPYQVLGPPGVPISLKSVFLETPCSLVFVELCLQGDQGDEFFIIMEGKAIVTQCPAEGEETKEVNVLILNFHSHFLTRLVNSDPRTTLGRSLC